ncbi:MAG TPA: molybdenum cofactor biosynthesis protein MoaE [Marmoricola sp.]|nr:molybdenum cofactor biosynthesis protein MoaE [Marmoricola sp.]
MTQLETAIAADATAMMSFADAAPPAEAGAVATFVGIVRDHDHGRGVTELEYVGHDSAEQVLRETVDAVLVKHPDVLSARVAHRVGLLAIGDRAFYVEIASAHRGAAFAACEEIVEDVKRLLPIWKRQVFTDATEEWVNSP